ncbi:hypothetical protein [Pantoea brenneri]|uniref:hypothetical protein n=1 Tax=Pantoea brenneri TaxID=472694 RepID=UPI00289FA2BF|nr:hypothetical protein [Pantoea brenneri]
MKSKFHLCRLQSQNEINVTMVENNPSEPLITPPDKGMVTAKHLIKTSLFAASVFFYLAAGNRRKAGIFKGRDPTVATISAVGRFCEKEF